MAVTVAETWTTLCALYFGELHSARLTNQFFKLLTGKPVAIVTHCTLWSVLSRVE